MNNVKNDVLNGTTLRLTINATSTNMYNASTHITTVKYTAFGGLLIVSMMFLSLRFVCSNNFTNASNKCDASKWECKNVSCCLFASHCLTGAFKTIDWAHLFISEDDQVIILFFVLTCNNELCTANYFYLLCTRISLYDGAIFNETNSMQSNNRGNLWIVDYMIKETKTRL